TVVGHLRPRIRRATGSAPFTPYESSCFISYPWTFIRGKFASENSISFRFTKARPSAPAHSIRRTRSASRSGIRGTSIPTVRPRDRAKREAVLVREDDVLVHLLVRDGTVETMEGTDARDEEDHLRPVRALPASDGKAAAGESSEGPLLETHASTNRRRGINIPHHEGEGEQTRDAERKTYL